MIKSLLQIRFRSLIAGMTAQARKKGKDSKGVYILFAVLYLYVFAVIAGMMGLTFYSLAEPYHAMGLDWLYFALAGLMGLGFAVIGSAFATQSQLYDAKDNPLLLSMPIPPKMILLSRMIPLLIMNLLFSGIVFIPAVVVYYMVIGFSPLAFPVQLVSLLSIVILAQTIACLLGWLLHLMLSRLNKSFASVLFLVVFLGLYFWIYSQANTILTSMVAEGQAIADALSWVWPIYAMGQSCAGEFAYAPAFPLLSALCFTAVYVLLSATFLKTATMSSAGGRRTKLVLTVAKGEKPSEAIIRKELRKFLGTPVYLTNMGLGILMTAAMAVAGLIFRSEVLSQLSLIPQLSAFLPLAICATLSFGISTTCITAPIISLEGKNLWILKSLPVSAKEILLSKLRFHCRLSVPVCVLSGLILSIAYGCDFLSILFCALIPGLLVVLNGLTGLICNLQWIKLDYISEAYPCKQALPVMVTMFGMMGVPLVLGLIYAFLLAPHISPSVFLALAAALLSAACLCFYRLLCTWGVRKWNQL